MVMKKLDMNIMETFSGVKVCLISLFMDGMAIEKMDQYLEVQKVCFRANSYGKHTNEKQDKKSKKSQRG